MVTRTETQAKPAPQTEIQVKIKKRLTVPLISMAHRDQLWCKIDSTMEEKHIEGFGRGENSNVTVVNVTDLTTGEQLSLVCGAVIKSALQQAGSYEGRYFLFKQGTKIEGKRYRPVDVYETEAPGSYQSAKK